VAFFWAETATERVKRESNTFIAESLTLTMRSTTRVIAVFLLFLAKCRGDGMKIKWNGDGEDYNEEKQQQQQQQKPVDFDQNQAKPEDHHWSMDYGYRQNFGTGDIKRLVMKRMTQADTYSKSTRRIGLGVCIYAY
jgi:hypothetical protein